VQGVVVVYNLDPDTTEEQLVWIFSRFGDVKDIQQAPMRSNQKFIEFWDVRHAATALRAMNRAELSRLPAAGPSLSAGPAAAGGSSSALAGMVGHEQEAAGGSRPRGLSGDGSAARTGDGGASSSSSHAYAAAQVAAAMQQLEMEQQQQQLPFQRSPGQPIPRPPSHDPQVQMAMQHADALQQQVAQRGMVRPVSGMLDRMQAAVSPPLNLGPLSQSWDTSGNPGSLVGLLNRQQQQQQQPGQQQQQQQSMLQQQQQQLLLQQLASGLLRGSRTDLSGLVSVHLVAQRQRNAYT
jgi:protein phosphatase 1 regulatory subunit 42